MFNLHITNQIYIYKYVWPTKENSGVEVSDLAWII